MQAIRHFEDNRVRWSVVAVVVAGAIALGALAGIDPRVSGQQAGSGAPAVQAQTFVPDLANGPIAGMPRETYQALTGTKAQTFVPDLANGPIAGMPRETYEELSGRR